jgi:ATP-dependent RNA helicase DeaD
LLSKKVNEMKAFADMGLDPRLVEVLKRQNFVNSTEVQEQAIPVALEGKDVIARAKTGTGKTLAFLVPIRQRSKPGPYTETLILAPTRELALQIADVAKKVTVDTHRGVAIVYGGASINVQVQDLRRNPDIVVGTPGRVIDLMERGALNIDKIKFLVLDEADTMLDMGFITDVEFILSRTPQEKQTMIFSATMPEKITRIANKHMHDPVFLRVGEDDQLVVTKIKHYYAAVDNRMKFATLLAYIRDYKPKKAIIFAQTKYAANAIYAGMKSQGLDVILMHGGLTQSKREHSLREFKGRGQFLIATNVAARGIDIFGVSDVINFDVPEDPHTYVHRVGRSARMDADGRSFTIVNNNQRNFISDIEDTVNVKFERITPDGSQYRDIIIFQRSERREGGGGRFQRNDRFGPRGGSGFGNRGSNFGHSNQHSTYRNSHQGGYRGSQSGGYRGSGYGHRESSGYDNRDSGHSDSGSQGGQRSSGFQHRGGFQRGGRRQTKRY